MPNYELKSVVVQPIWPQARFAAADHTLIVRRDRFIKALSLLVCALAIASLVVEFAAIYSGHPELGGFRTRFDLDAEANLPTLFSTLLILSAAALAGLTGRLAGVWQRRDRRYWTAIAWILVVMAIDEQTPFHNLATLPVRSALGTLPSALRFAWVIPALGLTFVVVAIFLRFFWRLPARTRFGIALASAIYVGGAVGMEMIAGVYHGGALVRRDAVYIMIFTIEEMMEMAGMIVCIHYLLRHIEDHYPEGRWRVRAGTLSAPKASDRTVRPSSRRSGARGVSKSSNSSPQSDLAIFGVLPSSDAHR